MKRGHRYISRIRPPFDPNILLGGLNGSSRKPLEDILGEAYGGKTFLFGAARQGLDIVFRALGIGHGSAVVIADYNCSCLLVPIKNNGIRVELVDLHKGLTYDISQLEASLIKPDVRAFVITHYFGQSAWTPELKELVEEIRSRGILIVEDCAHSLLDDKQRDIGRVGDVALFSFGNDKPLSAGKGGCVIVRKAHYAELIQNAYVGLQVRSLSVERVLALWHIIYSLATEADRCFSGISCEATSVAPVSENEFRLILKAVADGASLQDLNRFKPCRAMIDEMLAHKQTYFRRAISKVSRICHLKYPVNVFFNDDLPVRMNFLMKNLLCAYFSAGMPVASNAVRVSNLKLLAELLGIDRPIGVRVRYTHEFECKEEARRAALMAKRAGIEAGCFNWRPLLSDALGQPRVHPAWAVNPNCVINYPMHPMMTEKDIRLMAKVIGGKYHD